MFDERSPFNLIHEPWLPMRRRSGSLELVPPWRITDRIADDPFVACAWPRPDFNGAAQELLIGLLCTAAAPEDEDAWDDWWHEPPAPEVLEQRFSAIAHAFNLDGGGPRFLQDLDPLDDADSKPVAALLIDTPGVQTLRNNADLFVKRGGAPVLCRAAASMALFTLNCYAPSGGAGHRTSLRGGGPMTTLIVAGHPRMGDTLWGRLWPNVEGREQIEERGNGTIPADDIERVFPWLAPTRTSNPKAGGRDTTPDTVHPLQVYWGMPRRIRLRFEAAQKRGCALTAHNDRIVVSSYRTRNYGVNYAEGFAHPLTPYYRSNPKTVVKLPAHPAPGGISFRLWPGLVVASKDGLREPARVIRHWLNERVRGLDPKTTPSRFVAFGYDMDNMKARAWIEGEMPLWRSEEAVGAWIGVFIRRATAGANSVARLLTGAVKSALFDRPKDATGDYGFIAERFFRDAEGTFHTALGSVASAVGATPDGEDPTLDALQRWAPAMAGVALRLFEEYAPLAELENRDMHRHVKAHFHLTLALGGRGKVGKSLFDGDLEIPSPATVRSRRIEQEAA